MQGWQGRGGRAWIPRLWAVLWTTPVFLLTQLGGDNRARSCFSCHAAAAPGLWQMFNMHSLNAEANGKTDCTNTLQEVHPGQGQTPQWTSDATESKAPKGTAWPLGAL